MGHVTLCSLCRPRRKQSPKKTGIWAELERHLTEFITCQRHNGVLHTKEQVRVHNNIVNSPQAYGFLGFLCTASERLIFIYCSEFCGFQDTNHQTKATASSVSHSLHIISSLRLGPGWKFGMHFRARQELSQYRVAFAFVFFGLVVLFSLFFFVFLSLSFASDNKRNMQQCTTARQERTGTETLDS